VGRVDSTVAGVGEEEEEGVQSTSMEFVGSEERTEYRGTLSAIGSEWDLVRGRRNVGVLRGWGGEICSAANPFWLGWV